VLYKRLDGLQLTKGISSTRQGGLTSTLFSSHQTRCLSVKDSNNDEKVATESSNSIEKDSHDATSSTSKDGMDAPLSLDPANALDSDSSPLIPGAQTGGRKLVIVYTCTVCETRSMKQFTENAYLNGVVMVQCPGCQNWHLIADRLGYFSEDKSDQWDLDKIAATTGQPVQRIQNVVELDLEKVWGADKVKRAREAAAKREHDQHGEATDTSVGDERVDDKKSESGTEKLGSDKPVK
jgi:DNL zinc finger